MQTIKSNKAMQCKLFYTYEAPPFTSHLYISAALCCIPVGFSHIRNCCSGQIAGDTLGAVKNAARDELLLACQSPSSHPNHTS